MTLDELDSIAVSNALTAFDQMDSYASPQEAIDAYLDNAIDTAGIEVLGAYLYAIEEYAAEYGIVRNADDDGWVRA